MKTENILIIGAHYDDAELGAGATAAKFAAEGKNVYKLTLTDNKTDFVQMGIHVDTESSKVSSANACKILGINEITDFKTEPCNELTYSKDVMQRIENVIYAHKIDTVFMHFRYDMNQDHIAAAQLCLTASRHCRNVLAYQSNNYICEQVYNPVYFVDVSDFYKLKIKALEAYGKEHNRFDRLFQTKLEMNHIWGAQNKVEYAEGFHIIKMME